MRVENGILKRLRHFIAPAPKTAPKDEKTDSAGNLPDNGGLFRLWAWALPLLLGFTAGWFCLVCLEVWLNDRGRQGRPADALAVSASAAQNPEGADMSSFLRANPFKITPKPFSELGEPEPGLISGSLTAASVLWPVTGIGVLLDVQGTQRLVLINDSFDVYTLEAVDDYRAIFVKGGERVVKELFYSGRTAGSSAPAPGAAPAFRSGAARSITAADPAQGIQGEINRELVNRLMENPFEELKKVRLRPAADEQGLQIEWIAKDSILAQLGVRENDVVRAINGIPLRNAMDMSNSVSSLMNSDRFDVEVTRENAPASLQYIVR